MATIERSIDVQAPLTAAYNQWTQFEEFPEFMENVDKVEQIDDRHLHWKAKINGVAREWDAEISEQVPDQRIAWHSTDGVENSGVVTFHYIQPYVTKVMLQMNVDPDGLVENVADKLGFITRNTEGDLERFKEFIERRGEASGGWRGEIENPNER
jgi:uncharacterized membrane protein